MKKFFYCLLICLVLSGCLKYESYNKSYETIQKENYESTFNSTFRVSSKTYTDHKWNMNLIPLVDLTDNKASTRGVNANGNEWESQGYDVPDDITGDELNTVLNVFNQKGKESYESLLDLDCYFVQQVYKGTSSYTNHAGGNVIGSDHMDWLCTVTNKHVEVVSWWPYEEKIVIGSYYDDHINNFNNGKNNTYNGIMLMVNTNSDKFGFKSSEDNGHVFYNFRMEKINGNYYVGFDFEANGNNPNEKVDRDYIYNDWIVKIVPGKGSVGSTEVERVRIMCEDLCASRSDFDYNDVVFDIKFIKNGNTYIADIILRAAGGTLPLVIGDKEVHQMFGVATNVMYNTEEGHDQTIGVPMTVTLEGNFETAWDAINALPVRVQSGTNGVIHLTVNPGSPAEMIAVPITTDWSDERIPIQYKYPLFVEWIKDPNVIWWEE